jgi:hypothetical protein
MQITEITALIADLKKNLDTLEGSSHSRLFVSYKLGSTPPRNVLEGWLEEFGLKTADMVAYPHRRPDPVIAVSTPNRNDNGIELPPARFPKGWIGIKAFDPLGNELPDHPNPIRMHSQLNAKYATWIQEKNA